MAGLVFVSPGAFTDPSDLPTVPASVVLPVPGAVIDWAADKLPAGAVPSWTDMLGNRTLEAPNNPNQYPATAGAGANRRLVFDGANDRMLVSMNMGQPVTMVVVARSVNGDNGEFFLTGWNTQSWNLGINNGGRFTFFNGGAIIGQNADTNWHVFVVNVDGDDSVLNIDGSETPGTANAATWQDMSVGSSASAYSNIEVKRLAVIPRATSITERAFIVQRLSDHYGI